MGGSSGGSGLNFAPLMNPFGNLGNKQIENKSKRAVANIVDVSGANTNTQAAFGGVEAADTMRMPEYGTPEPIPAAPAPAAVAGAPSPFPTDATTGETENQRRKRIANLRRGVLSTIKTGGQGISGAGPELSSPVATSGKTKLGS